MAELHVNLNGIGIERGAIQVPRIGPWFADLDLTAEAGDLSAATINIGEAEFKCTIDPSSSGTFGERSRVRVLAGAGGWGKPLAEKFYHNDAGVRAETVARDAAEAVGETLESFAGGVESVGIDYTRRAGPASSAIEDVARGAPWWVGYDGLTRVGPRVESAAPAVDYKALNFDPRHRQLLLAVDNVAAVGVGSIIAVGVDSPLTIKALEIKIDPELLQIHAWCPDGGSQSNLVDSFRAIVARLLDGNLFGIYRYRVVTSAGRLSLQTVNRKIGLPDMIEISAWPGFPGAIVNPKGGTECLVQFIDGDKAQPVVTNFRSTDSGVAFEVARNGDTVEILLPTAFFTGSIIGPPAVPITGFITYATPTTLGTITTGSTRAKMDI